jgi:hypothetical protein
MGVAEIAELMVRPAVTRHARAHDRVTTAQRRQDTHGADVD